MSWFIFVMIFQSWVSAEVIKGKHLLHGIPVVLVDIFRTICNSFFYK